MGVDIKKIVLGLDLDGVILDHTNARIAVAKEHGYTLTPEQTPSDIIRTVLPAPVLEKMKYVLYDDPVYSLKAPLMAGVVSALQRLHDRHINFVLISRRENKDIGRATLEAHGIFPKFFNSENVFFVSSAEEKNTQARACGVTHYVDDQIYVLNYLTDIPHRFLFDPMNVFQNSPYPRFTSWDNIDTILNVQ